MFAVHEHEARQLRDSFDRGCRGRGQVALVEGPVASGKTELLAGLADHALEHGALVLQAIAGPAEREVPLGVVSQLVHSPVWPCPPAGPWEGLFTAAPPLRTSGYTLRPQTVHEVTAALVRLARDVPMLILVDDVQHADPESVQCLSLLVHHIRAERVTVALAELLPDRLAEPALHADLLRLPHCRCIELRPLSLDETVGLLAAEFGPGPGGVLAPRYHELTGGNLRLVRALVDDQRATAQLSRPVPGLAFRHGLLDCLARGGAKAQEVARAAAVLGDAASADRVAEVTGLPRDDVAAVSQELEDAGILAVRGFRHPVAASAVLTAAPDSRCAELRRRAARLLHDEGADADVVARLLVAAGGGPEPWAVDVLASVGERALGDDDVPAAVRCLELAFRGGDGAQRQAVLGLLADAEWRVSPSSAERRVRALTAANPCADGRRAPRFIRHLLWAGRLDEAASALVALDDGSDDPAAAAELDALRMGAACVYPGLAERLPALGRRLAPRDAVGHADIDTRWHAARILRAVLQGRAGDPVVTSAEHVLAGARLTDGTVESLCFVLRALVYVGRSDRARPECDRLLAEAASRGAPTWRALFAAVRAEIAVRQGDLLVAREHGALALSLLPAAGWGVAIGTPLASMILVLTAMAEHRQAEAVLERPLPEAMMQSVHALPYLHARGHHQLAMGRVHEALRDFRACGDLMTQWAIDLPALVPWRTDCAEAYLRIGDGGTAAKLVDRQLDLVNDGPTPALGVTLRVLAHTHAMADRPRLLMHAVDQIKVCGDRLELARALADLGLAHHALGDPGRARLIVRRAWQVARGCHAESVCSELRPHLSEHELAAPAGDEAERMASLTAAERRTAALALQGYSNREIARKLFITVSTVEQHLTHAYRKLRVGNRADLPLGLEHSGDQPCRDQHCGD